MTTSWYNVPEERRVLLDSVIMESTNSYRHSLSIRSCLTFLISWLKSFWSWHMTICSTDQTTKGLPFSCDVGGWTWSPIPIDVTWCIDIGARPHVWVLFNVFNTALTFTDGLYCAWFIYLILCWAQVSRFCLKIGQNPVSETLFFKLKNRMMDDVHKHNNHITLSFPQIFRSYLHHVIQNNFPPGSIIIT
jgi:hypothetical protein